MGLWNIRRIRENKEGRVAEKSYYHGNIRMLRLTLQAKGEIYGRNSFEHAMSKIPRFTTAACF
jgi:hypothetical protein